MRIRSNRAHPKHLHPALRQCVELLAKMCKHQERYAAGIRLANQANIRRGLREFAEDHNGLLNAAYSVGDYLKQIVSRTDLDRVVTPMLAEPNIKFHRELRNTIDHTERIEFGMTYEVNQVVSIAPSQMFPSPDLNLALARGAAVVEAGIPRIGKAVITYNREHLSGADAGRLTEAASALGLTEAPSVLYMAQACYERLLGFVTLAQTDGKLGAVDGPA